MQDVRTRREERTVAAMIEMYCAGMHGPRSGLCEECARLLAYARQRLERCPFGGDKPTCAKCPVHCYRPEMRARIRTVMRYSGPRMLLRHPVLSLCHLVHGWRPLPQLSPALERRMRGPSEGGD